MVKQIDRPEGLDLSKDDKFLIDANVLVMLHCSELSRREKKVAPYYSNFIAHLLNLGCSLYVTALNVQEMFHAVERVYYSLYRGSCKDISKKDYRKNPAERVYLAGIQRNIWQQVEGVYQVVDFPITRRDLEDFVSRYHEHQYDPIDFVVATNALGYNIVTDDCDFDNASDLTVYTYCDS